MVLKHDPGYCPPTGMLRWLESKTLTRRSGSRLRLMWRRLQQVAVRQPQGLMQSRNISYERAETGWNLFTGWRFWCT
eukprot:4963802-Amphidinium_carterae.1